MVGAARRSARPRDLLSQTQGDLAAAKAERYAVPVDIGLRWTTGAAMPTVVAGQRTLA